MARAVAPLTEWETYGNGMLKMLPITGMGSVSVSSSSAVVRIEYAATPEEAKSVAKGQSSPSHLQLGLSLEQLEQFSDMLARRVKAIRSRAN